MNRPSIARARAVALGVGVVALGVALLAAAAARADEPSQSPWTRKIVGQEEYVYVWTQADPKLGITSDALVTVDARPGSPTYGSAIARAEVGSVNEAHRGGPTDDRTRLWLGSLDSSRIFVFDVATDPAAPRLVRTIDNGWEVTGGLVGPSAFTALPGRMLVTFLSTRDGSTGTGMAEFANDGRFVRTIPTPEDAPHPFDARPNPKRDRLLTSSFAGKRVYLAPLEELAASPGLGAEIGDAITVWSLPEMEPLETLHVGAAPLEIHWASSPGSDWAVTATALARSLVLVRREDDGRFGWRSVADVGDIIPVGLSLSADDRDLYLTGLRTGELKHYDMRDPERPQLVETVRLGAQAGEVVQSWDGRRIYVASSFLSAWDKPDATWWLKKLDRGPDGKLALDEGFVVDFAKLGRPHHMTFGSAALYETPPTTPGAGDPLAR
jgi:methanethiol oxidase